MDDDNNFESIKSKKRKLASILKLKNEQSCLNFYQNLLFDIQNDCKLLIKKNFINHIKSFNDHSREIDKVIRFLEKEIKHNNDIEKIVNGEIFRLKKLNQGFKQLKENKKKKYKNIRPTIYQKKKKKNICDDSEEDDESEEDYDEYDNEEEEDEDINEGDNSVDNDDVEEDDQDSDEDNDESDQDNDESDQDYQKKIDRNARNLLYIISGKNINNSNKKKRKIKKKPNAYENKFLKLKKKKVISKDIIYFKKLSNIKKKEVLKNYEDIIENNESNKPYLFRALELNIPFKNKSELINKIDQLENSFGSGENQKLLNWVENIFKVPFGIYVKEKITSENSLKTISKYLNKSSNILNNCIYGHENAKNKIMQIIAQNISNNNSNGIVLGIKGPMGNGKTTLVENGISKVLERPFAHISLGGSTDASFLEGHSFTYEGSTYGKIIDILIKSQCMNPIIYFDELDKVSDTPRGEEIINILMHLIDPSQNKFFQDKYFCGIDIDVSKCIFIFSYNDSSKINPILWDRITEIETRGFKIKEKIKICREYLIPIIEKDISFNKDSIIYSDEVLEMIIEDYTLEGGVRKLKEKIYEISREINLKKMKSQQIDNKDLIFPLTIDKSMVKCILNDHHTINHVKIHNIHQVGKINGLYACDNGTGGLTPIETLFIPSDKKLDLFLTGNQGKIMKESMEVAKTLAWNILPKTIQEKLDLDWEKNGNCGVHINCPEAATPKDGPSAGTAITTALISRLINIPIFNNIAITGEIDLSGNVLEIGGLDSKLYGAKKAGVKKVLISTQNKKDLEKIKKEYPDLIDKNFEVVIIETIWDSLDHCLVKNNLKFQNHTIIENSHSRKKK